MFIYLRLLPCFFAHKQGATSIEYALVVGGIALAVSVIIFTTGDGVEGLFTGVSEIEVWDDAADAGGGG